MVDYRGPVPFQQNHRKPVPVHSRFNHSDLQPLTKIVPDDEDQNPRITQQQHSSYTSSGIQSAFPPRQTSRNALTNSNAHQPSSQNPAPLTRRTPSQSTSSSAYTGFTPSRTPSNVSSHISRTSSTRSGASVSPGSYVALMRKQKATVWCDRAQHEDPRIAAQKKAARVRAAREINSSLLSVEGRTSTSGSMGSSSMGVRSKIRHHGVPKTTGYSANLVGGGVPMRLSANEVGDEGTYRPNSGSIRHERTGSRGSAGSQSRFLNVGPGGQQRYSSGSPGNNGNRGSPGTNEGIPELEETPVPGDHQTTGDYFSGAIPQASSGSSSERESSFGKAEQMKGPSAARTEGRTSDELRRRGSVDERTNTMGYMGSGRLFVANPDLSD